VLPPIVWSMIQKKLQTFRIVAGHPVRDIVKLAADLNVDLLVIGATFGIVRANGREPRGSHHATRPMSGAYPEWAKSATSA
jgi:hypothetical protein